MVKKYLKIVLKISVSLAFLFWVIFKVDWINVLETIRQANIFYLLLYSFLVLLGIAVSAYKWKLLANYKSIRLNYGDFFKYYLAGTFINNFMPSFVGGDTFKAYETGKNDSRYVEAASAVMMDRITGLFGATILALAFTFLNLNKVWENKVLLAVNVLVFFSFVLDIVIAKIRKHPFWGKFKKYFPEKFSAFMIDLGTYSQNPIILKKTILLAFLFDFVGIVAANYVLFLALGIKIGIVDFLSVIFLISIISSVPVSINNIGIKEWAYIAFFGAFGVGASPLMAVSIISRFIQMFLSFFALPVYLKRSPSINYAKPAD